MLGRLASLVKRFVTRIGIKQGLSQAAAEASGGKIFTFGSYRLGVHGPGSDIDTLCVVPKHVSREDFFEDFEEMLKATEGVDEASVRPIVYPSTNSYIYTIYAGGAGCICPNHQDQDFRHTH